MNAMVAQLQKYQNKYIYLDMSKKLTSQNVQNIL